MEKNTWCEDRSIRTIARRVVTSPNFHASIIYLSTGAINAAVPFLLLPVLTRYLTPSDYGIVAMFQVLVGIVGAFVGLSVHGAIARQYFERDTVDLPVYIANCLYILMGSSLLVSSILLIFSNPISIFIEFPKQWLWSVVIASASNFIVLTVATLWQVRIMPVQYATYLIAMMIANVGLSLWFVVGLGAGWKGRLSGQVLAYFLFALLGVTILKRGGWLKWHFNKNYTYHALGFGLPLLLHDIGNWAVYMTDRILIVSLISLADAGVYTVAAQVGMIIFLIQDAINRAWVPWFYEQLKRDDYNAKLRIVKITYIYYILMLFFALFVGFIAPWLFSFFVGKDFRDAGGYVVWIALAFAFNGMYKMVVNYIFFVQDTRLLPLITFGSGIVNILVGYFFIKINGTVGAAQAKLVAYSLSFVLTWLLAAKLYKMPWRLQKSMY